MKEKPYVKVAMYALNIIFAIIIIVPVIYCFNVSMMDLKEIYGGKFWPSHLTLENYTRAFQLAPFFTFIKNSLIVSGVITFAQVVTGALAAYAFAMMEFKGKKVLFYIMLATMMIPSQAIIIANYLTIADWGIRNTYAALILPNAAAAFAVFNMRQAFLTLPKEIHEAAEIDGCTNFKFLYTIGVPLIKPSLGALIIYVFLQSWNYYLWPLLVTDSVNMRTVQIGLGMLQGAEATDFRPVMAGAMVILIPSILVFIIGQKQMISGLTAGAVILHIHTLSSKHTVNACLICHDPHGSYHTFFIFSQVESGNHHLIGSV